MNNIVSNPQNNSSKEESQPKMEEIYLKLKYWIEDSLDLFKNDLLPLLYPIFLHIYFDLIARDEIETAKKFFRDYRADFPEKTEELRIFESIYAPQHLHENSMVVGFRTNKYFLIMGRYAYDLLINFLEENNLTYILKIMNQHMEIKAQSGAKSEERKSGIDACVENTPIDLNTSLVAPNDFYFASGGADRQAIVWCIKSNKPERLFLTSLSDVTVVKFHTNGNYLFTGSSNHKIRMHDVESSKTVRTFCGHSDTVTCIDISHDGKLMVLGSKDKTVILWDIDTSKILINFVGHESIIYSVSFSYFGTIRKFDDFDLDQLGFLKERCCEYNQLGCEKKSLNERNQESSSKNLASTAKVSFIGIGNSDMNE